MELIGGLSNEEFMTFIPETLGFVSTDNSTSAILSAGEVFTGPAEDVKDYSSISVSWDSDVASSDNGCLMQFSTDGTNWDRSIPVDANANSLQTNFGGAHRLTVITNYYRIV